MSDQPHPPPHKPFKYSKKKNTPDGMGGVVYNTFFLKKKSAYSKTILGIKGTSDEDCLQQKLGGRTLDIVL